MYFIGLDVHKKTISFWVKDAAGRVHQEGKVASTRHDLDSWVRTLPQPGMIAMEATIFTGGSTTTCFPMPRGEGSASIDVAGHYRSQEEERPH